MLNSDKVTALWVFQRHIMFQLIIAIFCTAQYTVKAIENESSRKKIII
jgi:hypothetical protein